jgi:hypothetical protein
MPRSSSLPLSKPCVHQYHIAITPQREDPVPLPRPPRERTATSRVYRHTVKRQHQAALAPSYADVAADSRGRIYHTC